MINAHTKSQKYDSKGGRKLANYTALKVRKVSFKIIIGFVVFVYHINNPSDNQNYF